PLHNAEANVRFQAYTDALARHGLPFVPELIDEGSFSRRSGGLALNRLLARNARPDVIVAANDGMALGAVTALRSAGFRVPDHIAVTGFDDLTFARLGDPPLTTVSQPVAALARGAINLAMRQIAGEPVPDVTSLPTRFMARESCGCHQNVVTIGGQGGAAPRCGTRALIVACAAELGAVPLEAQDARDDCSADVTRLVAAIAREFDGSPGAFMAEVDRILVEVGAGNERYQMLQTVISRLRRAFTDVATPELEDLWHQARSLIALTNTRRQEQLRQEHDQAYYRLVDNGERFAAALDLPTLKAALSGALQAVGMDHSYISYYPDPEQRELECFVAMRDGVVYEPVTPRFAAEELMPLSVYPESRRITLLLFPLSFDARNQGVAVFEARPGVNGYQIVRDQISAALRSIELHQEILQQTTLHERRIQEQERLATAKRIQSLSVLAGGVAHDLNNVLGPLVALPDLIAEQLDPVLPEQSPWAAEIRTDISTIRTAALRASQTIKDLLTLGRQGRMAKEPLDLSEVVSRCLTMDGLVASSGGVHVNVELSREPLFILASEPHLQRAVNNLVRNALEAIEEHGVITVQTSSVVLSEPTPGYEIIEPGSYALVKVTDTGRGISSQESSRLFEPFFSSKRLNDHCGSGLGLAIVHGVVKEHGGFINVESTLGRGTTFTLYIPRTKAVRALTAVQAEPPRGSANILVVDDEPVQLRTCRRVLTSLGYRVDTLSSGREAYRLFCTAMESTPNTSPYDLVILDMLLNEEDDGLQVFNKICALYPNQKAILASGHAPSQRAELAMDHGLTWLAKPYTRATLARAVHGTLIASPPVAASQTTESAPPSSHRPDSPHPSSRHPSSRHPISHRPSTRTSNSTPRR
ncbi:MAG: substrate-binding domain-containing protein, partial [Myxococcales bacterium]